MNAQLLTCDVLVVGAGPAGLAAAAAARESGADVICIDLFARAGGQYTMQPAAPDSPFHAAPQVIQGREAIAHCQALGVRILLEAEIFWAEPGFIIFAHQKGEAITVRAKTVVAATGGMERPIPFEGWTLPGVISAGAAQRLVKANGTRPGKNIVLAGTGPFLFAVADTFAKANVPLRAYVERQKAGFGTVDLFISHPSRFGEALGLLRSLRATGAHRYTGHGIIAALGQERVEAVRIAPLGEDGLPDKTRAFTLDNVDCLCVGHGFQPVTDFTSLLKATHRHDDALGGWYCVTDPRTQATDVAGLFAAGETAGIGGFRPARLSGRLAGLHAAQAAGRALPHFGIDKLHREMIQARNFAARLAQLFPFPTHIADTLPDHEIVCRCEDVSQAQIKTAIADGAGDVFSVKMWTRAGMGPCQGRVCGSALAHLVAGALGKPAAEAGYNRPHMPLRPVPLAAAEAALALADLPHGVET